MAVLKPRWVFATPDATIESAIESGQESGEESGQAINQATAAAHIAQQCNLSLSVAKVLVRRGFGDVASAQSFLHPGIADLHPTALLHGIAQALPRIQRAIATAEKILLYGDYDVDGTSAIVILKTVFDLLGARSETFVPHRVLDGYGMKEDRIRAAAADGVGLIVSVDTGIRAAEVVLLATQLGIDTIVTDHHLPDAEIPRAAAVLNPNQPGCDYPNKNLCGAGVAFKLGQALLEASTLPDAKQRILVESLLKIAALATVADIVPLVGENRAIVKLGLAGLAEVRNPGLRALLDVSGIEAGTAPTSRQVGFQIGPRINAAGRMSSASEVLDLFFTRDAATARRIAATLDELNRERQQTEQQMREQIFTTIEEEPAWNDRLGLVLFSEDWHIGIAGICAGRVAERQRKPTFVLTQQEKDGELIVKGSGRSIPGFHLLDALESMRHLFTQFGGHEQAAGVSLKRDRLPAFIEAFAAYAAAHLNDETRRPVVEVDEVVTVADVTSELYDEVQRMAPFGYGNQPPVFAILGGEAAAAPRIFSGKHIRLALRQHGRVLNVKGWNAPPEWLALQAGARLDAAFQLEHDRYDGWSAILKDLRPA